MNFVHLKSTNDTDVIFSVDKVKVIHQTDDGCDIWLDGGTKIKSEWNFEYVSDLIFRKSFKTAKRICISVLCGIIGGVIGAAIARSIIEVLL